MYMSQMSTIRTQMCTGLHTIISQIQHLMHNVQLLQVEVPQFLGYPTGDRIAIAKSACPEHPNSMIKLYNTVYEE